MRVERDVLEVLDRAVTNGNALALSGQIDRKLYEQTNKVLTAAGGKWDKKAKAHLFAKDAASAIEPILLTGSVVNAKQELGAFYTPPDVVRLVMALAALKPGLRVLEPSAGHGALASAALLAGCKVDCIEIDPKSVAVLKGQDYSRVLQSDFLEIDPAPVYDRVIMNPPFAGRADIRHVTHAAKFLKPGGRLVSVMSSGVTFRVDRLTQEFRSFVEAQPYGSISDELPTGAFKASGTSVNTVIAAFGEGL
jgi:predicted RNA methylase